MPSSPRPDASAWPPPVQEGDDEGINATGVNGNQFDISLFSAGAAYVFVRTGTVWTQQAYLKASNTGNFDVFGADVAVSGDTAVVGAPGEGSNATGVNGNQANQTFTVNYSDGTSTSFTQSLSDWFTPQNYAGE